MTVIKSFTIILVSFLSMQLVQAGSTTVSFPDVLEEIDLEKARKWHPPNFKNQEDALGYDISTFSVPPGMEERVSFWIDIYTKFNTNQGLLHDSRYVNLVYEVVDFTSIMTNENYSKREKQKLRRKMVKEAKNKIKQRLTNLQKYSSPAGLDDEDLRYWYLFKNIKEHNRFKKATHRSRLRFQLGQSNRFYKGIYLSGLYLEKMEKIFKDSGLPVELTRLPFVESSFNYKARSKVGASGIWQFMRYTGKRFLKMNVSVDERNDPIRATEAAARMLKANYKRLDSWPLAVTGYNHGPSGVRRLVNKFKTRSIAELVNARRGSFGFASANFYASFLAAITVEKNAKNFYEKIYWKKPQLSKEIKLTKNISKKEILKWFNNDHDLAKTFNPHIKRVVWRDQVRLGKKNFLRVPEDIHQQVLADLSKLKKMNLFQGKSYKVSNGDTLSSIAYNFGVSLRRLRSANANLNPRRLRIGQKIFIPRK
ncbi:MAG: transglycosylase SLT domain-containing protein [Bdellovibrionaceae bacterium]|jgi:membrane-bound lytic murein transglycosylase D|nr:transglycosylase SLT domain-containing protein [Pseudobdellovibrionaceae bacterium]